MKVSEIVSALKLEVFAGAGGLQNEVKGGYTSDLLSDVMGHASEGNLWITLQTHKNVLAIASLRDLAGIILVNDNQPDEDMALQAGKENIPVLRTSDSAFTITGKLFQYLQSK